MMNHLWTELPANLSAKLNLRINGKQLSEVRTLSPNARAMLTAVGLFVVFFSFMAMVQFSTPDMPDNDGYYHIKLAYLMRTEGLVPEFPWLPLTILNAREFYDHHFLFHVALMPFTFGDLILGAKWASVVFASLAFVSVWWLLYSQKVRFAWLWSLGLMAVSEAFIYRMSITRAQSLSLAIMAVGLTLMFKRKHRWLLPLAFVYVWFYDAFPLLLILAGLYVASEWLIERRFDISPLIYTGIGIALGLLINPYFPQNIFFAIQHILPKLSDATSVRVGNEWYPYTTEQLIGNSPLGLLAFVSGIMALGLNDRKMSVPTATSLLMAVLSGLMLFQARRFVEYFPAFALVFAAFAWNEYLGQAGSKSKKVDNIVDDSKTGQRNHNMAYARLRSWAPALVLALVLLPGIWMTLQDSRESINRAKPFGLFQGATDWLQENTPEGSRVFQTDWDDFPRLFFYNTHNTYLVGLDPTYMQLYNAELYETWVDITKGRVEQPSDLIATKFKSNYVVTDLNHESFLSQAERDPNMVEVYRDDISAVFVIR